MSHRQWKYWPKIWFKFSNWCEVSNFYFPFMNMPIIALVQWHLKVFIKQITESVLTLNDRKIDSFIKQNILWDIKISPVIQK